MKQDDVIRMKHMLDAAKEAVSFAENKSRKSLDTDRKLVLALVKLFEIMGEAAVHISPEYRESIPHLPWLNIIGMRNRLVHAYFDINLDILWATVKGDIPPLIEQIELILYSVERDG